MASSMTAYGAFDEHIARSTIDLDTDGANGLMRCALVTSSYTANYSTHSAWADVSANEIAAGNGYSAGGIALTNVSIVRSGTTTTLSCDNIIWTASGGPIPAWRHAIFYVLTTRNGVTNPLMLDAIGDTTPADIAATPDGARLVLNINPSGIWAIT